MYQQTSDTNCDWIEPSDDPPYIPISHDESTCYSDEMQSKKWLFPNNSSFFNKGRGRSLMLSYFLVQHKYVDLFSLSEEEWKQAIADHPHLLEEDENMRYESFSADAYMEPGKNKDGYFDNEIILKQFERLFILLKYKTIFKNHKIVLIVDNARTHTAKKYDSTNLFKKEGTNCPYDSLEWEENGKIKKVNFFFDKKKEKSKGLFNICKELKLIPSDALDKDFSLGKLRETIKQHKAFDERTNLEILAEKHNVKLLFSPKFHVELNPIEGFWCFLKQYIRKRTDQSFDSMFQLIQEAKIAFSKSNLNSKLWRRFWQAINMYHEGLSYSDIINLLYNSRKAEVLNHRRIYNTIL
jgi:hypothetical protein